MTRGSAESNSSVILSIVIYQVVLILSQFPASLLLTIWVPCIDNMNMGHSARHIKISLIKLLSEGDVATYTYKNSCVESGFSLEHYCTAETTS